MLLTSLLIQHDHCFDPRISALKTHTNFTVGSTLQKKGIF